MVSGRLVLRNRPVRVAVGRTVPVASELAPVGAMLPPMTVGPTWWMRRSTHAALLLRRAGAYVLYALRRFYNDNGLQAAGALTYTTLLALVPLMTIAFSIFSAFPAFQAVQDRIEVLLFENLVPEVGLVVRSHISEFARNATNLTAVGVVALAVSAVLLLSTIESVLNTIWRVDRERPLLTRLLIFWTVLTLGPVLLGASFSMTTGVFDRILQLANETSVYVPIPISDDGWNLGSRTLAALLQATAFTVLFLLVPARPVRLRDAAIGGAVAGVAFEFLKWGFRLYLIGFPSYQAIYGALAAFPIFLIWLYLSWTVVLIGAVFAASFPEWRIARLGATEVHLDAPRRLEAAVRLLAVFAEQAKRGGTVSLDDLTRALRVDERELLLERLRGKGYLVTTENGGYALTRDLRATPLVQLARDLDLTLGLGSAEAAGEEVREIRRLDGASGHLAERLADLSRAEERILGLSVAEAIGAAELPRPDIVTLPHAGPQGPRA